MGIFYNPPPPPTANNAGTPPERHVPIGTQGNQPPRYTTALMMVAVLAAWPPDLEPRLSRPNDQQQKIAPLTLTYGNRPTPQTPLSVPEITKIVAAWSESWGPQSAPKSASWNVPPILSVVPYRPLAREVVTAWEPPYIAPPRPVAIAPLTLTYGAQPTPQAPLAILELAQIVASWPVDIGPALPFARTSRVAIAPLTLTYGSAPQPQPPLSVVELHAIAATWAQTWDAQTAPKNAAWNVPPILSAVAYAPLPRAIWTAWEPPWIQPPAPVAIVTRTLPTGTAPPLNRAALDRQIAAVAAWTLEPAAPQILKPTAGWNVPAVLVKPPFTASPFTIRAAWEESFRLPQRLTVIAPLTLVYGATLPASSSRATSAIIVASWMPEAIVQRSTVSFIEAGGAIPILVDPEIIHLRGQSSTLVALRGQNSQVIPLQGRL